MIRFSLKIPRKLYSASVCLAYQSFHWKSSVDFNKNFMNQMFSSEKKNKKMGGSAS